MNIQQKHIDEVLKFTRQDGDPKLQIAPLKEISSEIPSIWVEALSASDPRIAINKLWNPMQKKFPKVIRILNKNLQGIGLLTTLNRPPSLVYFFKKKDFVFTYRGFVPKTPQHPASSNLPQEFLDFYSKLHDGWRDILGSMGPYAESEWTFLSPNPDEPAGEFLVIFNNGGSAYMGFDLEESPALCYILWGDEDEPPEIVPDVCKTLDTWISDQLKDFDPV